MKQKISVLISVYRGEDPSWFTRALHSITLEQTRRPDEVVLVTDGPLTETLEEEIRTFRTELKKTGDPAPAGDHTGQGEVGFRVIRLPENRQL